MNHSFSGHFHQLCWSIELYHLCFGIFLHIEIHFTLRLSKRDIMNDIKRSFDCDLWHRCFCIYISEHVNQFCFALIPGQLTFFLVNLTLWFSRISHLDKLYFALIVRHLELHWLWTLTPLFFVYFRTFRAICCSYLVKVFVCWFKTSFSNKFWFRHG